MKKLIALLTTLTFAFSVSTLAQASSPNGGGWATQAGPLVTCHLTDGTQGYIPSMLCKNDGGTFNRN